MKARDVVSLVKEAASEYSRDNVPRLGAALAYYTVFSIAPILVIAIAVAGLVFGADAAKGQVSAQLQSLLGQQGAQFVERTIEASSHRSSGIIATIVGAVTLLFGASGAFLELQSAMNAVWNVEPDPNAGLGQTVRTRLVSFAMILVVGFLLVVSLVASALVAGLGTFVGHLISLPSGVIGGANFVVFLALLTGLFALMFKYLPDTKIAWRDVWVGAVVTGVLFSIGKLLIGLYLGQSSVASTYGAAGSLVVLLLWVYYSAQILLLGAEFTQVYAMRFGSHTETGENADEGRKRDKHPPPPPEERPRERYPEGVTARSDVEAAKLFYPHLDRDGGEPA